MPTKQAQAFSPAGISSFFQICDTEPDGTPIKDLERIGARGGGFATDKGVFTEVNASESRKNVVQVFINRRHAPEAETTKTAVNILLDNVGETYNVKVRHRVEVPIGAGFGTSGGGALGTALALSRALNINLTYNEISRIAHIAEVKCKTGLGTVSGLVVGGCVIVTQPGAPNHGSVDRIPVPSNHHIVAGVFQPRLTKGFLESAEKREVINEWGQRTLQKIMAEPSLSNFLRSSREFAFKTRLATDRVKRLMDAAEEAGAVGAAQNMLGEAVHTVVEENKVKKVVRAFERFLPREKIVVARICLHGAHLAN